MIAVARVVAAPTPVTIRSRVVKRDQRHSSGLPTRSGLVGLPPSTTGLGLGTGGMSARGARGSCDWDCTEAAPLVGGSSARAGPAIAQHVAKTAPRKGDRDLRNLKK